MSFLNQSSQCYNGNDIYSSNRKEKSSVGVLEFEDIFNEIDLQNLKKPQNKFEKNNSLHISLKKPTEDDIISQCAKEKARTETIQNQSSINNLNENFIMNNNFKKLNSFYSKALNLNKNPLINEEPIKNPFQKKSNFIENISNVQKTIPSNNFFTNNDNNQSLSKICHPEKNASIEEKKTCKKQKNPEKNEIINSNYMNSRKNSNDESQNIVNIIKHLTMNEYNQNVLNPLTEGEINSTNIFNNCASFEDFQKFIDDSKYGETIRLPHIRITIPTLKINKPLIIQGSVHTILEINEGPILIDLSGYLGNDNKVIFSECNISFDIFKLKSSLSKNQTEIHNNFTDSNNKSSLNHNSTPNTHRENSFCLFRVKGNSHLELRDCVIKSTIATCLSPLEELKFPKEIQDICFILKSDINPNNDKKNIASLSLKSCRITNFFSVIESHAFSTLSIEKCHFSDIKGYCINCSNILLAKIKENAFEKIEKSCINLRFSRDSDKNFKRSISIKENEFKNSSSYGISAFSENCQIHQNIYLAIIKNIFSNLRKDIICLKNLSFNSIEITHNDLTNSKQNGITLENCIDIQMDSQIELSHNKIFNCGGFGLSILDSPSKHSNNEIFQNEKGGINLFGVESIKPEEIKHFSENPIRIILNECNIYDNNGFGIGITGLMKGPVLIIKCYIYENLDGIFVRESEELKRNLKNRELNHKKINNNRIGKISLEKSSIFQNKRAGVYLDCLISEAFISETLIKDNQNQAVILTCQKDKNLIKFKDKNIGKLRDFVHGFIGGPWGELYEEKNDACKGNNKCEIF